MTPSSRRRVDRIGRVGRLIAALASLSISAATARAESGLTLPYPTSYGKIPAATFDTGRQRVGEANLAVEQLDDGMVRLFAESGVDGGARTVATALLAPTLGGSRLQPIRQESHTFDASNVSLGTMRIDHLSGEATCSTPRANGEGEQTQTLTLPDGDRVANVPLNLLFDPLVRGAVASVDFQIVICTHHARLIDFQASVARRQDGSGGHEPLVEVRYGPDLGGVFSLLARAVVPRLSFWFDPDAPTPWIAHRMPLYADGPEVFVVRQGIETSTLLD